MGTVTLTMDEYEDLMRLVRSVRESEGSSLADRKMDAKPKKRKKSKYQRELGRQLKMLKKKHPRTAITKLMKRAHRATKKAMKK